MILQAVNVCQMLDWIEPKRLHILIPVSLYFQKWSTFLQRENSNKVFFIFRSHVPFRDSKLTQLLKNSLGGNSMTSVIWTISPNVNHLSLSISTLEFAKRAKNIKNTARVNELVDDHDIVQNVYLSSNFYRNYAKWRGTF